MFYDSETYYKYSAYILNIFNVYINKKPLTSLPGFPHNTKTNQINRYMIVDCP